MTIAEVLSSTSVYPIPENQIEKICIDNGLTSSTPYDATVSASEGFQLAQADTFMFLFNAPSISEQELRISVADRENFWMLANQIYGEWDSPKFSGLTYGFVGESLNG